MDRFVKLGLLLLLLLIPIGMSVSTSLYICICFGCSIHVVSVSCLVEAMPFFSKLDRIYSELGTTVIRVVFFKVFWRNVVGYFDL